MKITKLIAIIGIATLLFTACGSQKKVRCPDFGEKTTTVNK